MNEEYLRRNLIHCGAIGVHAGISKAVGRLRATKRPPKWLVCQLEGLLMRAKNAHQELAMWRNNAPDTPERVIKILRSQDK